MSDRQRLVDQLIRHEALRLRPYMDTVGKITIGVGRNLSDVGISHQESMMLLERDIDAVVNDLANFPWFAGLDPVRQIALADMRFNLGAAGFRSFKRMLRMFEEGNFTLAGAAARDSLWYQQVKGRGVRVVHQIQTGEYE